VVSEDGEVGEGYRPISDVVSPEALFGSESMWPTPNDWEIVAVPHDAADQEEDSAELLRIAEDGDLVSLVEWCDEESKTTGKRGKAGDEDDLSATLNRLRSEK
jgi:hypothetical protein